MRISDPNLTRFVAALASMTPRQHKDLLRQAEAKFGKAPERPTELAPDDLEADGEDSDGR